MDRPRYAGSSGLGRALPPALSLACIGAAAAHAAGWPVPPAVLLSLTGLLVATVALGVVWQRAGVFARPLLGGAGDRPLVALTFDDGPDPVSTPRVLDLLDRHGARATFFVIGKKAAAHPGLLHEIAARGHQVENHSYHHARTTTLQSADRLAAELGRAQEVIHAATGRYPRWFRPPVGLISPPVAEAARRTGLRLCGWTRKARDGVAWTTPEAALRRLLPGLRSGAILLLHDGAERGANRERPPVAAEVLEGLLPLLTARGLRAVTLDELLNEAEAA